MKSYRIGRGAHRVQIRIGDDSLSALHAELVKSRSGRYYLTDCASTNGTFQLRRDEWVGLKQGYVEADTPLKLGEYKTTVRDLLTMARDSMPRRRSVPSIRSGSLGGERESPVSARPKRNPETGEVIEG